MYENNFTSKFQPYILIYYLNLIDVLIIFEHFEEQYIISIFK